METLDVSKNQKYVEKRLENNVRHAAIMRHALLHI